MHRVVATAVGLLLYTFISADQVSAGELRILAPGATEGALGELLPQFEKSSGHKITISYGPAGGLAASVRKGEPADVVILSEPEAESLRKGGQTVEGSQTVVAKVGIGVFVRRAIQSPTSVQPTFFCVRCPTQNSLLTQIQSLAAPQVSSSTSF